MKRSIIFTIIGFSTVFAISAVNAANKTEVSKPIDLDSGYLVVNSTVVETTTTTTMPVITVPEVNIEVVNTAIEEGETLTVEQLREKYGKCGEWHDLAIDVGFTEEEWPKVSQIIWKESRCTTDAWNGHDAGLTQINQIHTEWLNQMGYSHPDDMFDPRKNLEFAYKLYSSREEEGKCGWQPWSLTC